MINVGFSKVQIKRLESTFRKYPRYIPRIMRDSINKTAVTVRKESVKSISILAGLIQKHVRKYTFIDKATIRHFAAKIRFSAYGFPYAWLKPKPSGGGLLSKKTGEYQHGGFLLKRGKSTVAMRRIGRARYPITMVRADKTIADYYDSIKDTTESRGGVILEHHIDMQVKRFLEKI